MSENRFMVRSSKAAIVLGLVLWMPAKVVSQNITETKWYFGNSPQNLIFDKNGRDAVLEDDMATPFGSAGCAVISDQFTGNLLFYSDGQLVYDRNHQLLPSIAGGTVLSGDPTLNQPVVACPVPGATSEYYFITNNGVELQASVVDASQNGNSTVPQFPAGEVTSFINQPIGLPTPSEGMIIIETSPFGEYWLISQNRTSFDFEVTRITSGGFTTTQTTIFSDSLPGFEAAQFAFNEDSLILAVASKTPNRNVLILDFDPSTGILSFNQTVRNTGFNDFGTTTIYDVEWSGTGAQLYISRMGDGTNPGRLYQVDFADTVNTNPFPINEFLPYTFERSYGLRRGIDNRIYHLYQGTVGGPFLLGRIFNPDSVAANLFYDSLVFDMDFNGTQFPAFAPASFTGFTAISFDYLDSCQGNTTKFFPTIDPMPNNYLWIFGQEGFSTAVAPIFSFTNTGPQSVTLLAELNGRIGSFNTTVNILTQSDTVDLGNDTTICVNDEITFDAGVGVAWIWNTGETTQSIQVVDSAGTKAGTYWVEVTFANGCTAFNDIVLTVYGTTRQIGSQWYFGEQAGLDFTTGAPVPITDANLMFSPEGCASISDINGELLFYTNGSTVWNKNHEVMMNGFNIGGDSTAAQSALIMPLDGDNTVFYIFTTQEVYGTFDFDLKYTMVDMKHDSAKGMVVKKNLRLVDSNTERITGSGFTGSPYILTHEYGNRDFRTYQITAAGLQAVTHSSIGEPHRVENRATASGYTKFSPSITLVAMLLPGDSNQVELLNFDLATGELSNPRLINLDEPAPAEAYGLEFSGDELKLYISMTDPVSKLIQLDLDSLNSPNEVVEIEATKFEYPVTNPGYGALQLGPDGVIYLAMDNLGDLGSITNPGANDAAVGFSETGQTLSGRISRRGLPNFTQIGGSALQQPSITVAVACVGLPTTFAGTGRDSSIEEYFWDFGDGFTSTDQNTTHIYLDTGSYTVQLILSNRCDTAMVLMDTVDVFTIPEQPDVESSYALCDGSVTVEAWPIADPALNYYWSTGDTTRSVTFTAANFPPGVTIFEVRVALYNDAGCPSDTIPVLIGDVIGQIDLGANRILCQNDTEPILDSFNNGPDYSWTRDGVVIGTEREQEVSTSIAGTFTYAVAVSNPFFPNCIARDSVQITINAEPDIEQAGILQPDCGEANGSFEIAFGDAGSFSYSISGPVNLGPFTFDGPGSPSAINGLSSGSYLATATNLVTGCVNTEVFQLEDEGAFQMEAEAIDECARTSDIRVTVQDLVGSRVDVTVRNDNGDVVFSELGRRASNIFISDLDTGLYYVEVQQVVDPFCIQNDTVQLDISIRCYRTIFAPNAFTPNGDPLNNEFFVFPNQYIDQFQIFIYNRWGQIIYTSEDRNFRWSGDYNGIVSPPGTYAYKMVFTSTLEPEIGEIIQYGSITLIR